jgi:hypothetical protein
MVLSRYGWHSTIQYHTVQVRRVPFSCIPYFSTQSRTCSTAWAHRVHVHPQTHCEPCLHTLKMPSFNNLIRASTQAACCSPPTQHGCTSRCCQRTTFLNPPRTLSPACSDCCLPFVLSLPQVKWVGAPTNGIGPSGVEQTFTAAAVGGCPVSLGSGVVLFGGRLGLVQCLWEDDAGHKKAQVRTHPLGCVRWVYVCERGGGREQL